MDLLCVATSVYNDPHAEEWHSDLRLTVSFLRRHNVDAGFIYLPVLDSPEECLHRIKDAQPTVLYFELTEENRDPILGFFRAVRHKCPRVSFIVGGV